MDTFLTWLSSNILQIFIILSVFIQISPIKWNPITSFVKWFGKIITKDLTESVEVINEITSDIQWQVDENEKDRIRWEILAFANSCRQGILHTKDEFEHVVALNDKYKSLLAITGDKNGVFDAEYDYIYKLYKERQEKNDFL